MILNKRKIIIFVIMMVLFGVILYILPEFVNTEYYVNKESAYSVVQSLSYEKGLKISAKYINHFFWIYNSLCHIWGFLFATLIFFLLLKIKKILQSKKYFNIYKKAVIYIWINFSYFIWAYLTVDLCMNDLNREVFDSFHDSMGIPLLGIWLIILFFALLYFPNINLLTFFSYSKNIKNKFFNIIFELLSVIMLIFVCADIYSHFVMTFMPKIIFLNIIDIIWLMLGLKFLKQYFEIGKNGRKISEKNEQVG